MVANNSSKTCESCAAFAKIDGKCGLCTNDKSRVYTRKVGTSFICDKYSPKGCGKKKSRYTDDLMCGMCASKCVERKIYANQLLGNGSNDILEKLEHDMVAKIVEEHLYELDKIGLKKK